MKMISQPPSELVKNFYRLQEERVQTYQMFEEGFAAYLKGAPSYNFPIYRQLVHEITQTFAKISKDIIDIEEQLKSQHNLPVMAQMLQKIQDAEENKLEMTIKLQLVRKNVVDHPDGKYDEEVNCLKQQLAQVMVTVTELLEEFKYESEDVL